MENFSPSRIQPLSRDQEKNQDESRPRKAPSPRAVSKQNPVPPALDVEPEYPHQLDEQA